MEISTMYSVVFIVAPIVFMGSVFGPCSDIQYCVSF